MWPVSDRFAEGLRRPWLVTRTEPGVVHVHPDGDSLPHELAADCACGPTPEMVPNADGPDGWLLTHHSLDGREKHEQT